MGKNVFKHRHSCCVLFTPARWGTKLGAVRWGKKLHATLQALHREKQYEDEQVNKSIKAVGNGNDEYGVTNKLLLLLLLPIVVQGSVQRRIVAHWRSGQEE